MAESFTRLQKRIGGGFGKKRLKGATRKSCAKKLEKRKGQRKHLGTTNETCSTVGAIRGRRGLKKKKMKVQSGMVRDGR